jgi:hypothetical protein
MISGGRSVCQHMSASGILFENDGIISISVNSHFLLLKEYKK